MAPQSLNSLRLSPNAVHIITYIHDGQVIMQARDNPKTEMGVEYMYHIASVYKPEVLLFQISAQDV